MRMFRLREQRHQVDDVHDANSNVRNILPKQRHRRQSLKSGDIASARHDDVGIAIFVASQRRDPGAPVAMTNH